MRSIWKGSISFGLVNIPVAVYPATKEEKVSFKQLRKIDLSPIRYKKVAEADDKEVKPADIVKGYEIEKEHWITLTDEDLQKVEIPSTHTIEILDFVELKEINPKFFRTPYFLEAQKGGEKSYSLLHRALFETGKLGIAKVALRNREYLAAVRPDGLFLMLELMHFADEVLDPEELRPANAKDVTPKEVAMAKSLIESMAAEWDPAKYRDEYRAAVMKLIEDKAANRPAAAKTERPRVPADAIDLVAILQQSLSKAEKAERTKPRRTTSTAALVKQRRPKGTLRATQ